MYKSDIEIAQGATMLPIREVAQELGVENYLENYGLYKGKIDYQILEDYQEKPSGNLVLVTAINPTPAGEGKTTTTVGLGDALNLLGKKTVIALREPSLGPVFGIKGGAAGGGYAQVIPMEDINLHFTGDLHAVGAANNLLAALIDNHIHQGNALGLDPRKIVWKRCLDINDRQLRYVVNGLNGQINGTPREDGFDITVASEIMAILCLAADIEDLKSRLSAIVVGYTYQGEPVTAGDLKVQGSLAVLLAEALKPNLVQTLEQTPAFIHGGPFANIAHGCNSVMATKIALKLGEYVITEAGFGADLGAEKFLDIKCRMAGLVPKAVVIVASIRALKHHGGQAKDELTEENLDYLRQGLPNLLRHIQNIREVFDLPAVVAINQFPTDTKDELNLVYNKCQALGVKVALSEVWAQGGVGGLALAKEVVRLVEENEQGDFRFAYQLQQTIKEKIKEVVVQIYGGSEVEYSNQAHNEIAELERLGFGDLPICMAKTQYSFSDDPDKLGAPKDFKVNIKNVKVSAGARFIVALTGDIMTMPGLPKVPAAEKINIDQQGRIQGLF